MALNRTEIGVVLLLLRPGGDFVELAMPLTTLPDDVGDVAADADAEADVDAADRLLLLPLALLLALLPKGLEKKGHIRFENN